MSTMLNFRALCLLAGALASAALACGVDRGGATPEPLPSPDPDAGPAAMQTYGCVACHVIPGVEGARGQVGPPLVDIRSRQYIGARLPNGFDNLVAFILDPAEADPGNSMPKTGIGERDARDVAAYLMERT